MNIKTEVLAVLEMVAASGPLPAATTLKFFEWAEEISIIDLKNGPAPEIAVEELVGPNESLFETLDRLVKTRTEHRASLRAETGGW